ncbi:MAG: hypothetical protein KKE73_01095 [Proteobacteria bacterium]|nr:hypothetical protein [Pseudomonadota bacterium]
MAEIIHSNQARAMTFFVFRTSFFHLFVHPCHPKKTCSRIDNCVRILIFMLEKRPPPRQVAAPNQPANHTHSIALSPRSIQMSRQNKACSQAQPLPTSLEITDQDCNLARVLLTILIQ